MACTRSEQGTPGPLWLDGHGGPDKASREAALVTNSNGASPELEKCQSSAGLGGDKIIMVNNNKAETL